MPGGWRSIHPDMQAALQSIGIEEDQVLLGWDSDPQDGQYSHRPEGEIDGHSFSSTVDLPWELRSPELRRDLVDAGFAPFFMKKQPWAEPHIHAVYVGARDHNGQVTALASTHQLILEFVRAKPLSFIVEEADRPTPDERETVRLRYWAWTPHPHTTVYAPSGKPIDCSPFVEAHRPGVIRCALDQLAWAFHVDLFIRSHVSYHFAVVKGQHVSLPDLAVRQEDPWFRGDLLPLAEALGLQANVSEGPSGNPEVRLSGSVTPPASVSMPAAAPVKKRPGAKQRTAGETPAPDDEFTRAYRELVGRLFRPLKPADGLPEADLAAAEERLGLKLPPALRAVYRISGGFEDLHQLVNPLILPGDLQVEDGFLPFHDENQGVCQWALRVADLDQLDPPVYLAPCGTGDPWQLEHPCLSGFLIMMVYLQAVEGGLPHTAVEDVTPEVMAKVAREWPLVSDGGRPDSGIRIYSAGRQVIRLYPDAQDMQLSAAARTAREFRDIGRRLGIELNEC